MAQCAPDIAEEVRTNGFATVRDVLDGPTIETLIAALSRTTSDLSVRQKDHSVYAIRNLLTLVPEVSAIAKSPAIRALIEPLLGPGAFAVRGLLFDKTPEANWKVFWHQDLTVPVRERIETPGFRNWTMKSGVQHAEAPASLLETMLSLRLHLDDCDDSNGPLCVLPGSHSLGHLSGEAIEDCKSRIAPVECHVPRGGVMLIRPLLLHASFPAKKALHRRVIHLEFAAQPLPGGLEWLVS